MDFYSEQEQIGELRYLLNKYGKMVAAVVLVFVVSFLGWHFWQSHQRTNQIQSATLYQELSTEINEGNVTGIQSSKVYIEQHKDIYSVLLSMEMAKYYVDQKQYSDAEQALKTGIAQSQSSDLTSIMQIRLARIMYQQNQLSDALTTLAAVTSSSWAPLVNEVRGDILMAQHQYAAAITAYKAVLTSDVSGFEGLSNDIQLKINNAEYLIQTATPAKTTTTAVKSTPSAVTKSAAGVAQKTQTTNKSAT